MKIEIRLFATLKDRVGQDRISVTLREPADVQQLLTVTAELFPALDSALPTALVAVNKAYAEAKTPIQLGDEVAIFPPVSGGDHPNLSHPTYFAITTEQVDLNAIHKILIQPEVGAIVTFSGSVRGETNRLGLPAETSYLEYETYHEMAEIKMVQIAQEIWERWPLVRGIAIVQRIGKLDVGESTTIVACAAAHRDQGAFEAARYGIDRLKEIVPVWKKEVSQDQSIWIEGHYRPTERDN
jgi:molybdopterin converting factor subunit 1